MLTTTSVQQHQNPTTGRRAAFRIAVGQPGSGAHVTLNTSTDGCWNALLGDFELPTDAALDVMAEAAAGWESPPAEVALVGSPAACLLPLLWLRTIWLDERARVTLEWSGVREPGADPREQLAARLCCGLVSEVRCDDANAARMHWGIATGPVEPLGDAAFDLVLGLIDSWDIRQRTGFITDTSEWHIRMRTAMEQLRDRGVKRIAIYGAGTHTQSLASLLMSPPVEVVCIVDDDPRRQGNALWGFPILSRADAIALGVDAVILSANAHEPKLWSNRADFERAGVHVIRLYEEIGAEAAA
ncbi:MAG: hypothetical protein VYC34_05355 [Planctomycetota bacterium]|nr:hypothetical protein [Planctomycetota bacterium]